MSVLYLCLLNPTILVLNSQKPSYLIQPLSAEASYSFRGSYFQDLRKDEHCLSLIHKTNAHATGNFLTFFVSQYKVCYQITAGMLGKPKTVASVLILVSEEQAASFLPLTFLERRQVSVYCVSLSAEAHIKAPKEFC